MKNHILKLASCITTIWTMSCLAVYSDSAMGDNNESITDWKPSPTIIRIPKEITDHRSALSREEGHAFYLLHGAIILPEKAVASGRGRLIVLSEDERRLIGDYLKKILGSKLVPEEAVAYLGAYERQEGARTVRRYQLSYQQGTLRVAFGGELDECIPKGITVLLAEPNQAPRADKFVSVASAVENYPIAEIIEVDRGVETLLKSTILHFE
jgi:hypothetical protein